MAANQNNSEGKVIEEIAYLREQEKLTAGNPTWNLRLSIPQLTGILSRMPDDFLMTHANDFNFILTVGMRGSPKIARMQHIIVSSPMCHVREHSPTVCAATALQLMNKLHATELPAMAHYLLSGNFATTLAHHHPDTFATFFLNIVGMMEDKESRKFAKVDPVDTDTGVYAVIPSHRFQLPPLALIHNAAGGTHIKAIQRTLVDILPDKARIGLQAAFQSEADKAAGHRDYGRYAHLTAAIKTLDPK